MNECDALRSASHINVHKIHVKLTFIWSDLGARCESSSSSISPTHIPRHWPRAQSWVAAILFLPCFTLYYWVASSLYLFLTQIITVPTEPTLIFLLWEQGSSFIPTKNTAASRIKCRHCGNPGLAVSTWLNKKWRELRRWSTSCCRADFDLLLYCQVRMFLNCTTLHLKHKMTFHWITKNFIWMIL